MLDFGVDLKYCHGFIWILANRGYLYHFTREIKTLHKNLLSQNKQQIRGKKLIVYFVKGGGEESYDLGLQFPLEDIDQMKDMGWNDFVDIFNEFVMTFLKKDYDILKLNYLQ